MAIQTNEEFYHANMVFLLLSILDGGGMKQNRDTS